MESVGSEAVLEHVQFEICAHEYLANIIPTSSQEELAMYNTSAARQNQLCLKPSGMTN